MPDYEPIFLLPAQSVEYGRKPGGGQSKDPIVPVDESLRGQLVSQLDSVGALARNSVLGATIGIPLSITLRERALAKSNRPYNLLSDVDMPPVAAGRPGELVSQATQHTIAALSATISQSVTKKDTYAISTISSLRVWEPIRDAFRLNGFVSPEEVLEAARERDLPLRIQLFPWVSDQSRWEETGSLRQYLSEVGLPIKYASGSLTRQTLYLSVTKSASVDSIQNLYGIRSAALTPVYSAPGPVRQQAFRELVRSNKVTLPESMGIEAKVGVLDSGIAVGPLEPFVKKRWTYDLGVDRDETHGTFVAGLVVASRNLNDGEDRFPNDPALVYDAQILPSGSISEDLLLERIEEVLDESGESGPKVWNCSFNNPDHMDPVEYGSLSQQLDILSQRHGVLFVQSAGNYDDLRIWPPDGSAGVRDGLASPAESINSLTVGSLSHRGGITPEGAVSSYSRRGPSFGGQQKPEVTYWSGDVDRWGQLSGHGICSIGPSGDALESVGTSFATPIVSGIAANVWNDLEIGQAVDVVSPALVKGLLVHSATMADLKVDDDHRPYFGAGVPTGESMVLFDAPNAFTTIHEVKLRSGVTWEKNPFPMPECLIDSSSKIRGIVTLTVAYAPVIDSAFGDECVRTCVEPHFGRYRPDTGAFDGKIQGTKGWEKDLIERGKWGPVKSFRKVWSRTSADGDWALKLDLTSRDNSVVEQKVYVILTVESVDESLPVYQDGLKAIRRLQYPNKLVVNAGRLRVQNKS